MNEPKTFSLHGFEYLNRQDRQRAASDHDLWPTFCAYFRRKIDERTPDMDDSHDRSMYETYIEGAYRGYERYMPIQLARAECLAQCEQALEAAGELVAVTHFSGCIDGATAEARDNLERALAAVRKLREAT